MSLAISELRARLAELEDLRIASAVLGWDQQTMMPRRGAPGRAEALATLKRIRHTSFTDPATGRLLESAERELNGGDPRGEDALLLRHVRRRWEKACRVPADLAAEMARAASLGQEVWVEARRTSDFQLFAPYLERNLELVRRYIECFEGYECPYDVVLEDFEPGMRSREVRRLFSELKSELATILEAISGRTIDDSCVHGEFPVPAQHELVLEVLSLMGFDSTGWRIDEAVHPFATSFGSGDVRITTRWDTGYFPAGLYGAMHECGHGLYEAGISAALQRSPVGHPESLGLHESQSRLWENMVGRGRAFADVLAPMVAGHFGGALVGLSPDMLFRAVNRISPSLIRVEADEVTYGLHIILRFELEQALIEERLAVSELPEAWDAAIAGLLGLQVPDAAHGVLQDVHWSAGLIGYFPTYALGNLIAGQLWQRAHEDMPDLEQQIAAGELADLRRWLGEKVHRHGAKFTTPELLGDVVGSEIQVAPFSSYLKAKVAKVYEIEFPYDRETPPTHREDPNQ